MPKKSETQNTEPAPTLKNIVAEYEEAQRQLAQLAVRAELQNARYKYSERRAETRRKIIIGGAVLAALRDGETESPILLDLLRRRITAARDRLILGKVITLD